MYGTIPERPDNISSSYRTDFGWTIAMLLANKGIIPPKKW